MTNPQSGMPPAQYQFVKPVTGIIEYTWYQFLLTLYERTGGATGDTSGVPVTISDASGTLIDGIALNAAVLVRSSPLAPFTDTTDTARNYLRQHNFPIVGSTNSGLFINTSTQTWTISPGDGVTFAGNLNAGNFEIPAASQRTFVFYIQNIRTPAISIYG